MNCTKKVPTRDPVELLLRRIARSALLGGAATLTFACGGDDGDASGAMDGGHDAGKTVLDGGSDAAMVAPHDAATFAFDGGPPTIDCNGDNSLVRADHLQTRVTYDYLALERQSGVYKGVDDAGVAQFTGNGAPMVVSARGTPCASASSAGCTTEVQQPGDFVPYNCVQACSALSFVTTRGDIVEHWSGADRVATLLAPIDTSDEAIMIAMANGYMVPCGAGSALAKVEDGYLLLGTKYASICPIVTQGYNLHVALDGTIRVLGDFVFDSNQGCVGRIPRGLRSRSVGQHRSELGDYLANCAHLEAASVVAFERLACELEAHGAPQSLVEAAKVSARDEVRHARLIGLIARAHEGELVELEVDALPPRSLEEIALENATEGCVRETYGALVGAYQAEHAREPALAQAMLAIAEDEARHAALSHHVYSWSMERLDASARERVRTERDRAIEVLRAECANEPSAALRELAGLPSAKVAQRMFDELTRELWHVPLQVVA